MGEHGPHAIRRSPSGSWMVIVGNNATILDPYLDFTSPVLHNEDGQFLPYMSDGSRSDRQGAHSALFEWEPSQRKFRVFSGGNRNAYDFAFNLAGEAFLFDSDHEADIGLPWYREVRSVHQIPNGDYGYRDGSGKYPAYYLDSLPPVRDLGRGSPVGVEFYQSYAYPAAYFDNLLEADWSRGRILYTALATAGATYRARPDPAELVHGEPLNVTDLEVGPDGMIYFVTGGRNTQGGVYRLRYTGAAPRQPDRTGILAVVRQPQPLSSWGWAAIESLKASMGASAFGAALEHLGRDPMAEARDRARALYELQRHGPAPSPDLLAELVGDASSTVRAAVMFVAGYQGAAVRATAAAGLKDPDPMVRRRAAEALLRLGQSPDRPSLAPVDDIYALLRDGDRFVRWAGRILLEHTPRADWQALAMADSSAASAPEVLVALARTVEPIRRSNRIPNLQPLLARHLTLIEQAATWAPADLVRLYRAFTLTTTLAPGAIELSPADRARLHAAVGPLFPSTDEPLNREVALLIAYAGQPDAIGRLLTAIPEDQANQTLTLHYLYALRALQSGWTAEHKQDLGKVLGLVSRWRGGWRYAAALTQFFEEFEPLYTTAAERAELYALAPVFAPLDPRELAAPQQPVGRRDGGAVGPGARIPAVRRTAGRVLNKSELFDEVIYAPDVQQGDAALGRAIFEASCALCHGAHGLGNDHGVAALDLTTSARVAHRRDLLESIMFPSRRIEPDLRTTILTLSSGDTITGLVVRDTPQTLTLLRSDGTATEVGKPIQSRMRQSSTIMLDALTDGMTQAQLTNLLAFLQGK